MEGRKSPLGVNFLRLACFLSIFIIFLCMGPGICVGALIQSDHDAMNDLREKLGIGRFFWNATDPCDWAFVSCNATTQRVTGLNIVTDPNRPDYEAALQFLGSLSGVIPPSIGNLTELQSLTLRYMQLSGTLPDEINRLSKLTSLVIADQTLSGSVISITGPIPDAWANMTQLVYFDLIGLSLSGSSQIFSNAFMERLTQSIFVF